MPLPARIHTLIRFLTCPFLRLMPFVPVGGTLLDVGAGHGLFAALAADRGTRVVAVEPDIRKLFPPLHRERVRVVAGFDESIGGTFDAVSIIDVLYKVPLAAWDSFLGRAASRVASGGVLLIKEQDPTARVKNAWNRMQERAASAIGLTLGEAFSYEAPAAFAARLARLGFSEVTIRRVDFGYPHPHVLYIARRPQTR